MRRGQLFLLSLLPVLAAVAPLQAQVIDRSLRPPPNPAYLVPAPAVLPDAAAIADAPVAAPLPPGGLATSLRPRPRPDALTARVAAVRKAASGADAGTDLLSVRPEPRPEEQEDAAAIPAPKVKKAAPAKKRETASRKGSVCGVNAIKGEKIATIKSTVKGCGLQDGVRVTSISAVRLSEGITVDCATAKALNEWVDRVVQPNLGGDVVELRVAAHYICRSRNNVKGAKVSEHGRGKAVDISAFVMASGKMLSVAGDFRSLRKVYGGACGLFGTTLGPGSDGYHEDHFHLDTASRRSGAYCR